MTSWRQTTAQDEPAAKPADKKSSGIDPVLLYIGAAILLLLFARYLIKLWLRARLFRVITTWEPRPDVAEKDDHAALEQYIRVSIPRAYLEREYRDAGTTSDLFVRCRGFLGSRFEVYLELKRDFQDKTEYDRLVGQIEGLDPLKRNIAAIFCGKCDPQFIQRLEERYRDQERTLLVIFNRSIPL